MLKRNIKLNATSLVFGLVALLSRGFIGLASGRVALAIFLKQIRQNCRAAGLLPLPHPLPGERSSHFRAPNYRAKQL